jgi:putative ubiquitin-RnfH superfamily antitoxin RatB of RatAB toxin-antitoxin module
MADEILIEVAYARPDQQVIVPLRMTGAPTVEAAIRQSGLLERFPEIDLARNKVGIFSKITKLDATLRDKDRVEIYRGLIADPKEVRRKRAEEGKAMKKGGGDLKDDSAAE